MARFMTLLLAAMMIYSHVYTIPNMAAREDAFGHTGIFVCGPDNAVYAGESEIRDNVLSEKEMITVTEKRTITDVASYDVWKHINGTWQFGKKPGSAVSESFTIYIAGRLPQNAKVTEVSGSYDDEYSGTFSTWAVPTADINIKSFNDTNLTYTMAATLSGNPMNLRKATQSEYTEGYRYYIPVMFEVTYTVEKEAETSDIDKIEKDDALTGTENNANMSGTAKLELPETIYEGHPASAQDRSVFDVDGEIYGAARMYDEGLASNSFAASGNGRVKRINDTEADVTFEKAGKQNVTLKVKTKSGDALTDKKYIDVLKTPTIIDTLGGVQKENRKQVLSIVIAENPRYPLTELYVEIEKKGGAQRVHLEHDTGISDKGYGSNTNDNSLLIKTRAIKDVGSDKNFTRVEIEFLTKNSEKTEMTYRIFAKDTRGNTDKAEKDFTVMPDETPNVIIATENPQFRDEGVNIAYVYAEDATAYDGDDADRIWYVREEIVDKENGADASTESKEIWTDWIKASESDGRLIDASFGTWRGVAYKKNGVGKIEFRLDVTEKWTEATLDEYVSDADRKKGSGSAETTVDNIAPTVSFNAEKLKRGNLVMLAQSDEEKEKLTVYKADILRCLREMGISGDAVIVKIKNKSELNNADLPDTVASLTRPYGYSATETFLEKGWYMCDDDTLYTVDGTWTLNAGTSSTYSYAADAPYTIKAYDLNEASKLVTDGGESIEINDETQPKWQAVISKEMLGGASINNIKGMSQDDTGTYLYFVSESQTLIYDKKTGTLAAAVPFAFGDDNFVSESRIYTLKADGLYSVNLRSGKINCIYRDTVAMKKSYSDQEGSAQRINGEINFAAGKGNKLVRVYVNPVTEEVRLADIKPFGASYASTYNIVGFGSDGILCIGRDNMSAFHVFDRDGNELINKTGFNVEREHDIVPVYKSNGKFDYIAVLYNTYRRSGTSSSGYKYRYGINAYVYDIYEASSEPMEYSYERTTGSGGTSGCGHDAGKVMYAVQFGKTIVINTGNWSTCISDGSEIGSYYNTSFAQLVFDIETGTSKVYKNGGSLVNALNAGGVLCEYGKLCDEYVVSAYSNVDARNTFGNGMNRQMLKIARLPKTEDIEIAEEIDKLAPIKEIAKLDSAAVYLNGYSMSGEDSDGNKKL